MKSNVPAFSESYQVSLKVFIYFCLLPYGRLDRGNVVRDKRSIQFHCQQRTKL